MSHGHRHKVNAARSSPRIAGRDAALGEGASDGEAVAPVTGTASIPSGMAVSIDG